MSNRNKTMIMVEGAVMIALATVLSFIRIYKLPWGGSITLLSMLPIAFFSIRHGTGKGMVISFLFSLIQLGQGISDGLFVWGLTPIMLISCILFDYVIAYSAVGLSGVFRNKGVTGWIMGTVSALGLRFICHFLSGVVVWKSFGELWEGFSTDNIYLYSLLYNGSYMLPEIVLTAVGAYILFKSSQVRKLITEKRK
ncbi:MAG: energy-coupled thiamine transporter ThiT [Ruminococcus sp.]|nr:energy-coupled thiamine transporter ThiT [Ruminococcus sp.]